MTTPDTPKLHRHLRDFGAQGWGLLFFAAMTVVRGVCYLPPFIPGYHTIPALEPYLPMTAWAAVWIVSGVFCLCCMAYKPLYPAAFGVIAGLHALWAVLYFSAWLTGESDRGYVTALNYLTILGGVYWGSFRHSTREE